MRFLQITDTHFGVPANSSGVKLGIQGVLGATNQALRGQRIATIMATHNELVLGALRVLVELEAATLNGLLVTGDIATTGEARDLALATAILQELSTERLPCFVLPGNHDRFGPPFFYSPGRLLFETVVAGGSIRHATSPFSFTHRLIGDCLVVGIDLTLIELVAPMLRSGRQLGIGLARSEIMQSFIGSTIRIASERPVSHIIVMTHFPVQIGQPIMNGHEVVDASLVHSSLEEIVLGTRLPTLVLSGHLHTEYFVRDARMPLWHYTCASSCKYYSRPRAVNACALIETHANGFSVQRYDFDGSPGRGWFTPDPRGPGVPVVI